MNLPMLMHGADANSRGRISPFIRLVVGLLFAVVPLRTHAQDAGAGIFEVVFSPDSKTLAAQDAKSHSILLWDAASGKSLGRLAGQFPETVTFSADSQRLVVYQPSRVRMLEIPNGKITSLDDQPQMLKCVFSPDGRLELQVGSGGLKVRGLKRPFDEKSAEEPFTTTGGNQIPVHNARISPFSADDKSLFVVSNPTGDRAETLIWDVASKSVRVRLPSLPAMPVMQLSPDGKMLAMTTSRGFFVYDTFTGKAIGPLEGASGTGFGAFAFSPDSKTMIGRVAMDKKTSVLKVWSLPGGKLRGTLPQSNPLHDLMAFSADGSAITAVCADLVIRRWETDSAKLLGAYPMPEKMTEALGQLTAAGSQKLVVHNFYSPLNISPDGTKAARGYTDGTVRLWNIGPEMQGEGKLMQVDAKLSSLPPSKSATPAPGPGITLPRLNAVTVIPADKKVVSQGTKVFFQDADGNLTPIPDGNYKFENRPGYIMHVRNGEKVKF